MSHSNPVVHEISVASIFRVVFILLALVFAYLLRDVVMVILFAVIIASGITPFANWLDRVKFPRLLGVLLLYISVFVLAIFLLSLMIPFISGEMNQLVKDLPNFISKVSVSLEKAQDVSGRYVDFFSELQNMLDVVSNYLQTSSSSVFSLVVSIFGGIISFVSIIVISFYLSVMRGGIENFIRSVVPSKYEGEVIRVWRRSENKVGRWLQGQLLLALIVGVAVYVTLSLLGVRFALLLGIITMVLELVPTVGPVLSAIPGVILAFSQSPTLGLWVLIAYVVIQQLENHILVPIVLGKTTGLNPVVVIVALLIGVKLAGVIGMVLAVPVAAVLVEIIDEMVKKSAPTQAEAS